LPRHGPDAGSTCPICFSFVPTTRRSPKPKAWTEYWGKPMPRAPAGHDTAFIDQAHWEKPGPFRGRHPSRRYHERNSRCHSIIRRMYWPCFSSPAYPPVPLASPGLASMTGNRIDLMGFGRYKTSMWTGSEGRDCSRSISRNQRRRRHRLSVSQPRPCWLGDRKNGSWRAPTPCPTLADKIPRQKFPSSNILPAFSDNAPMAV